MDLEYPVFKIMFLCYLKLFMTIHGHWGKIKAILCHNLTDTDICDMNLRDFTEKHVTDLKKGANS